MNKWKQKLKDAELKVTPQRLFILKSLEKMGEEAHPDAEDIYKSIQEYEHNISRATVYRNLKTLINNGIINELYFQDGKSRYELNQEHHHHFVCISCGKSEKISSLPLLPILDELASTREVISHHFEVFGYCEHCIKNRTQGR